eukprot:CAMPEP_0119012780 /NCGR_PEP_ID=MMETSP1176-20130426/7580_1 /TAXON_ID=265551 /ORGANISM="Synedropsis recta cf, Strain CCMP1620" /LENGTH=94 /DNA_ID=CAMNT_0006965805 /DNA_START=66 /DNA_END=350 /DNA_ORIENTATION=+
MSSPSIAKKNIWVEEIPSVHKQPSMGKRFLARLLCKKTKGSPYNPALGGSSAAVVQVYRQDKIERRRREKSVSNSSTIQSWQSMAANDDFFYER